MRARCRSILDMKRRRQSCKSPFAFEIRPSIRRLFLCGPRPKANKYLTRRCLWAAKPDNQIGASFERMGDMNRQELISIDPALLGGKPVVKGTRISKEFVTGRLARGWMPEHILREHDHHKAEDIRACLASLHPSSRTCGGG